jgi:hypothetical protein
MMNGNKSDYIVRNRDVDLDSEHDEFVQGLKKLMGWYQKSIEDLVNILEVEMMRGSMQLLSIKMVRSIH